MSLKRAKEKSGQKVKDATTTTKILFGDNKAVITRFRDRLDRTIEDLRRLDAAAWNLIDDSKEKLYRALDVLAHAGSGRNENWEELKKSWNQLVDSAGALGRDLQVAAQRMKERAQRATNGA